MNEIESTGHIQLSFTEQMKQCLEKNDLGAYFHLYYVSHRVIRFIDYHPNWTDALGAYSPVVKLDFPSLEVGQVARSCDPTRGHRRILIVKTFLGNVVLYEKFPASDAGLLNGPILYHAPEGFGMDEGIIGGPLQSPSHQMAILDSLLGGVSGENIGMRLNDLMSALAARRQELGLIDV